MSGVAGTGEVGVQDQFPLASTTTGALEQVMPVRLMVAPGSPLPVTGSVVPTLIEVKVVSLLH